MCIRDSVVGVYRKRHLPNYAVFDEQRYFVPGTGPVALWSCLLYTSDAADERSSVDLGGRRIIKKKKEHARHRMRRIIQQTAKSNST